jgi:glycerol transport system ATP-binding protein
VVQIGTPVDLFERPEHTFVGHFIGSPGMNVLPCELAHGGPSVAGHRVAVANAEGIGSDDGDLEIGVRPEFVSFADEGLPVDVAKISDAGRYRIVDTRLGEHSIKLLVDEGQAIPSDVGHVRFDPDRTRVYRAGRVVR